MFTMETVVFLAILIGAVGADSGRERRILLHSDLDIAHELRTLKADSVQMQTKIVQLQNQNDQLQRNVSDLQNQNTHRQSDVLHLQSQNTQLQTDVLHLQSQNSQLQGDVLHIQNQNTQLQSEVSRLESSNKVHGSTYVIWGRTTCPANGTTLAYSGYMGGGKYSDTGAAVNRICLAADPIWDHYNENIESGGKVYGVEYEFGVHHRDDGAAQFFGTNLYNHDAPCAVCHSPRSATMMIPGRTQCYPGWTREYSGYLVSGGYDHRSATEYICLDRRPDTLPGGGTDDDDNVLYLVEGVCRGSLECPPYVQGRELTCVVCTK